MTIAKKALILVDLQNDFCPGGNLAVPNGDQVIALANELQPQFSIVIATKDWHPSNHVSFARNHPNYAVGDIFKLQGIPQILWPNHCEQGSQGAEFHPQLETASIQKIFFKGTDPTIDSYSAFFDNAHLRATGLADYLHQAGVTEIYVLGLATDYCVKYTALDGVSLGFKVFVIRDACRGVGLKPDDIKAALDEMRAAGVELIDSHFLLER